MAKKHYPIKPGEKIASFDLLKIEVYDEKQVKLHIKQWEIHMQKLEFLEAANCLRPALDLFQSTDAMILDEQKIAFLLGNSLMAAKKYQEALVYLKQASDFQTAGGHKAMMYDNLVEICEQAIQQENVKQNSEKPSSSPY